MTFTGEMAGRSCGGLALNEGSTNWREGMGKSRTPSAWRGKTGGRLSILSLNWIFGSRARSAPKLLVCCADGQREAWDPCRADPWMIGVASASPPMMHRIPARSRKLADRPKVLNHPGRSVDGDGSTDLTSEPASCHQAAGAGQAR